MMKKACGEGRLATFTAANAIMVIEACHGTEKKKSPSEWREIYDSTVRVLSDLKVHPQLDEVEALAASIIIIGSEYDMLFLAAFYLLQPWKSLRSWYWIVALELIRHHAISTVRQLQVNDFATYSNFLKELKTLFEMVPSIPSSQQQFLLDDIDILKENGFQSKVIEEYSRRYPLPNFSHWAVEKLQSKLKEALSLLADGSDAVISTRSLQVFYNSQEARETPSSDSNTNEDTIQTPCSGKRRKRGNLQLAEDWPSMYPLLGDTDWVEVAGKNSKPSPNIDKNKETKEDLQRPNSECLENLITSNGTVDQQASNDNVDQQASNDNVDQQASNDDVDQEISKKQKLFHQNENEAMEMADEQEISDISTVSDDPPKANDNDQHDNYEDDYSRSDSDIEPVQENASLVSRISKAVWDVINVG